MRTQSCFYLMPQSQHSQVIPPQSQPPVSRVTGDANLPAFFHSSYSICIRQEKGYCCIEYYPCTALNSFTMDASGMATNSAQTDNMCTTDYVGISCTFPVSRFAIRLFVSIYALPFICTSASGSQCNPTQTMTTVVNRYCGPFLNTQSGSTVNARVCGEYLSHEKNTLKQLPKTGKRTRAIFQTALRPSWWTSTPMVSRTRGPRPLQTRPCREVD